jgi:hypothetical protein
MLAMQGSIHHEHLWKDYVIDLRPCRRSDTARCASTGW